MVIWIAIYSLFNSMDFNDEVVVLYGSITFWVTLLLSVVLAVGVYLYFVPDSRSDLMAIRSSIYCQVCLERVLPS